VSIVLCYIKTYHVLTTGLEMFKLKTKSIRAKLDDAAVLEQTCRELSVELQRQVPVSELVEALTEYVEDARQKIKNGNEKAS
jgi:hypothetical protein